MPTSESPRKLVRSYRLVFRRRWRIHRLQSWRIPLPQGIELRAIGYWAACLAAVALIGRLPLLGLAVSAIPPSVRLLAVPIAAAWALARWELDGRSPHRALLGLAAHELRPHEIAGLRRCPPEGAELAPVERLVAAPDTAGPDYPHGRIRGPARVLLRYPSAVEVEGASSHSPRSGDERTASAPRWRIRRLPAAAPLHKGHVLEIPAGKEVSFE